MDFAVVCQIRAQDARPAGCPLANSAGETAASNIPPGELPIGSVRCFR